MRLFAINLHRSRERRSTLLGWIHSLGLPWEIFDAVDGAALRPEAVPWTNDHWGDALWPGKVGCFLSHARVLQRVLDYGLEWAVVLEDDMLPLPGRAAALCELVLPRVFDLIYLHQMTVPGLRSTVTSTEGALHRVNPAMLTTGAYIVSRRFAARFCAVFTRVEMPIDHLYRRVSCAEEALFFLKWPSRSFALTGAFHRPSPRDENAVALEGFHGGVPVHAAAGHFARHYAALGFTDIVFAGSAVRGFRLQGAAGVGGCGDHVEDCQEWSALAGLDESYEYPLPPGEPAAAAGEANCVQGFLVQRSAADGSLPPLREAVPMAGQFPEERHLHSSGLTPGARVPIFCRHAKNPRLPPRRRHRHARTRRSLDHRWPSRRQRAANRGRLGLQPSCGTHAR